MDYESMRGMLSRPGTEGKAQYDFIGTVHLMLACLDNLREYGLEAEFDDLACAFEPEQAEFFIKLARCLEAGAQDEGSPNQV